MNEFQYHVFFHDYQPQKISKQTFEADVYVAGSYFVKIFKITSTLYNRTNYLKGKEKKAALIREAFSGFESIVSPIAILRDGDKFCGILYPYIANAQTLGCYTVDRNVPSCDKFSAFIKTAEVLKTLHAHACVHCDLGVNNILIDNDSKIYVIDMDNCRIGAYSSDCKNKFVKKCAKAFSIPMKEEPFFDRFTLHIDLLYSLWGNKVMDLLASKDFPCDDAYSATANFYLQYLWYRIKAFETDGFFDLQYLCDLSIPNKDSRH